MPVTVSAKRALRGSNKKRDINVSIIKQLETALRLAKKSKTEKTIKSAISLADRAAKKHTIHRNKAARIKSSLSKLTKTSKKK